MDERASVPGMRNKKKKAKNTEKKEKTRKKDQYRQRGSVTIEASFGIPLFLFAALCLIWLIEIQSIRISITNAAQNAAKSAAEDTAVIPVLNTVKLKSDIVSLIGEDRISRSILKDGSAGISCWKSYVSPTTGEMNITVNYKIMIPLLPYHRPDILSRN